MALFPCLLGWHVESPSLAARQTPPSFPAHVRAEHARAPPTRLACTGQATKSRAQARITAIRVEARAGRGSAPRRRAGTAHCGLPSPSGPGHPQTAPESPSWSPDHWFISAPGRSDRSRRFGGQQPPQPRGHERAACDSKPDNAIARRRGDVPGLRDHVAPITCARSSHHLRATGRQAPRSREWLLET